MSSPNFIEISSVTQKYTNPLPFQTFKGSWVTSLTELTPLLPTTGITNAGMCRQYCTSNINCELWTYTGTTCKMFNSADTSNVSGIKVNTTLRTTPISPFSIHSATIPSKTASPSPSPAPSLEACAERCNVSSTCGLYTYRISGTPAQIGMCSLYNVGTTTSGNMGSSRDLDFGTITLSSAKVLSVTYTRSFAPSNDTITYSLIDNGTGNVVDTVTAGVSPFNRTIPADLYLGNTYTVQFTYSSSPTIQHRSHPVLFAATGGTSTDYTISGTRYRCHVFTTGGAGTLSFTRAVGTIEYFVVGAGGGGSAFATPRAGAGGGGGEVIQGTYPIPSTSPLTNIIVNIGTGGNAGSTGNPSSISSISPVVSARAGTGGGSATVSGGGGTSGNGNIGGRLSGNLRGGGGGTGGSTATNDGGPGFSSNFRDGSTLVTYGAGGGGGGGTPSTTVANTGGGGAGGTSGNSAGKSGAAGIVMIRYRLLQ